MLDECDFIFAKSVSLALIAAFGKSKLLTDSLFYMDADCEPPATEKVKESVENDVVECVEYSIYGIKKLLATHDSVEFQNTQEFIALEETLKTLMIVYGLIILYSCRGRGRANHMLAIDVEERLSDAVDTMLKVIDMIKD